jgi:hypothetical protein
VLLVLLLPIAAILGELGVGVSPQHYDSKRIKLSRLHAGDCCCKEHAKHTLEFKAGTAAAAARGSRRQWWRAAAARGF